MGGASPIALTRPTIPQLVNGAITNVTFKASGDIHHKRDVFVTSDNNFHKIDKKAALIALGRAGSNAQKAHFHFYESSAKLTRDRTRDFTCFKRVCPLFS
jgi:hypothetical protein